jgi:hypothetical protein
LGILDVRRNHRSPVNEERMLMPIFYRGAGVGTYWHENDARLNGFTPKKPGAIHSIERLIEHIVRADVNSPYISLTRSYGVAYWYAVLFGRARATETNPGYVYEIEISTPLPAGLQLLDPVKEVAMAAPETLDSISYQHDGLPDVLLGLVDPIEKERYLKAPYPQPPPGGGTDRPPNISKELEALVRALRDAEILAVGNIPAAYVRNRYEVWKWPIEE